MGKALYIIWRALPLKILSTRAQFFWEGVVRLWTDPGGGFYVHYDRQLLCADTHRHGAHGGWDRDDSSLREHNQWVR